METILIHGNTGKQPITTASHDEVSYLRDMKRSYPRITIAQFRAFFIEDVIENPTCADDVERYNLKQRSLSWYRKLFIDEGWISPCGKTIRKEKGRRAHVTRPPSFG